MCTDQRLRSRSSTAFGNAQWRKSLDGVFFAFVKYLPKRSINLKHGHGGSIHSQSTRFSTWMRNESNANRCSCAIFAHLNELKINIFKLNWPSQSWWRFPAYFHSLHFSMHSTAKHICHFLNVDTFLCLLSLRTTYMFDIFSLKITCLQFKNDAKCLFLLK